LRKEVFPWVAQRGKSIPIAFGVKAVSRNINAVLNFLVRQKGIITYDWARYDFVFFLNGLDWAEDDYE
jgi:hypothetical protein